MQPENTPEIFDWYNNCSLAGNTTYGLPAASNCYEIPASNHESFCSSAFYHTELPETVSDSTPEARALAASKNHREAERRRRERINSHLDCLRTLLPCNSRVRILLFFFLACCFLRLFLWKSRGIFFFFVLSCLVVWDFGSK